MIDEASPREVLDPSDCSFYHTVDLPSHGTLPGDWDLRGRFDDYVAGTELSAKSVLDVGSASGFLTFEAERRGARPTSFDISGAGVLCRLPIAAAEHVVDRERWLAKADRHIEQVKNGYWLCHRELGSRARCFYGDLYDIDTSFGAFDVVLVGQILVHLPDGISALAAAASVCRQTLVITEGSFEDESPVAALSGRASRPEIAYAWYQYSSGWYREVLQMLGFSRISTSSALYLCNDVHHAREIELTTVVASRDSGTR